MTYDIFISYRRDGGKELARPLKSELERRGYRVFLDFDELKDGIFDRRIMEAIDSSPIFMVVLSPHSLDRCANAGDWVRREIEYALEHDRHFIPVNPDLSFEGFPTDIPDNLKTGLGQHQFSEVMFGQLFMVSVDKMVRDRIEPILSQSKRVNSTEQIGAIIHIETDMACRIVRFGKEIGTAHPDDDTVIRLHRGKHKLEFIGTQNDADRLSVIYPVEENDMEDILTVELAPVRDARLEAERGTAERKRREQEQEQAARERQDFLEAESRRNADETFQVGDYYCKDGKEGIVFEVDASGRHGKIVSIQEGVNLSWCKEEDRYHHYNTTNKKNGKKNQRAIEQITDWRKKFPAFAWCALQGKGWYLPAIGELETLLLNAATRDAVNRRLMIFRDGAEEKSKRKYDLLNAQGTTDGYWSSTATAGNDVLVVTSLYDGCDGKIEAYVSKHLGRNYVRAVSVF